MIPRIDHAIPQYSVTLGRDWAPERDGGVLVRGAEVEQAVGPRLALVPPQALKLDGDTLLELLVGLGNLLLDLLVVARVHGVL